MEDALRALHQRKNQRNESVLILVLMEDALRVGVLGRTRLSDACLNPCSNGRCSASCGWFSVTGSQ